ncbi:UDP-N-acetylmuramate dehydrogenase [Ileibacterium valens]|uniref:UDP-N-acetylmuramate dehydrogenase n=1 Tax=Ileibacterium valens TaxID=1862668 RepID=UPI003512C34B
MSVNKKLAEKLSEYAVVKCEEPMRFHTTYRIGGPADYFIQPESADSLIRVIEILDEEQIPWMVLGRGSNVLVHDRPYQGAVIDMTQALNNYEFSEDGHLMAEAGCSLIYIAYEAMMHSLSGLEFASGIPGTIGGGLYMNAGAYRSDLAAILEEVLVYRNEKVEWLPADSLDYTYRHSIFQKNKDWVILAGRFLLQKGDSHEINELMISRKARRMDSQPAEQPCAGSVFRNPEGFNAWKVVDDLGYRGVVRGGATVSSKHSNFIVNASGTASAEDVNSLILEIQKRAREELGIELITEVERINWDDSI